MYSLLSSLLCASLVHVPTADGGDLKKLQGVWRAECYLLNGSDLVDNIPHASPNLSATYTLKDKKLTVRESSFFVKDLTYQVAVRVDQTLNPKQVDLVNKDKKVFRGIYSIDGDVCVVCIQTRSDGKRPTKFGGTMRDEGLLVLILRRVKP